LDLGKACHILCFLAGDADTASFAREGLGLTAAALSSQPTSEELPDFGDFVELVFVPSLTTTETRIHHFSNFTGAGQAAALHFGMLCLMNDLYGGENDAVTVYLQSTVDTLATYHSARGKSSPARMDLLDTACECLATTVGSSRHARELLVSGQTRFGFSQLNELVISASSSRARRYLAQAVGRIYTDCALWGSPSTMTEWLEQTQMRAALDSCRSEALNIKKSHFVLGPLHGSFYLGAQLVHVIRMQVLVLDATFEEGDLWEKVRTILECFASGVTNADNVVGNASADAIAIAMSHTQEDSPFLHPQLSSVLNTVLVNLADAIKNLSDGDATDSPRITKLVHAGKVTHWSFFCYPAVFVCLIFFLFQLEYLYLRRLLMIVNREIDSVLHA
jgi:hypothetical protein